ncbi:zinc ribbon domain-containing protein [Lactobacillus sp. PV034]|uniref:zinc ribbon domain-containing protein n=1 Tax=Lactobacillus sp. PV034 TaxID=2594495 RepID=UPI002240C601|nr:zinc ribbon domain-containing protein [Lactobacillus sp. PV034]QNQ80940.1 zinc ribbon domain-containing protein [Lactobacillus sp. PV034]
MKCPNCGRQVSANDERCPYCDFDLKKFNSSYFTNSEESNHSKVNSENNKTSLSKNVSISGKQNSTIAAMVNWIQANAIIVFLSGIGLLILMSFSRPLAWITFLVLMIWLFIVCRSHPEPQQYTVDQRLAEKVNQVGSSVANSVEAQHQKVKTKRMAHGKKPLSQEVHHDSNQKLTFTQLGVLLLALVSLFVIFFGPFATTSLNGMPSASITKVLLNVAGLGGKDSLIGYGLLLLFITMPLAIIVFTVKNKHNDKHLVFILSLIETIFLVLVAFELVFRNAGASLGIINVSGTGYVKQLVNNFVSFGISAYLLLISSILTTWLAWRSLKNKKID